MQNKNPNSLFGCDVNEFRGNIDFVELKKQVKFVYLRSSGNGSGKFRVDKKFLDYAQGSRDVGLPSGAYHFGVPSTDLLTADTQCDDFIKILQDGYGAGNYGDLFPVIDVEVPEDKSINTDALLNWINRFRKRFESKTRRKIMLYTGIWFIELYNNFKSRTKGYILSDMPLWIADYGLLGDKYPKDAGGWVKWRIWQYTDQGVLNGLIPPVDLNWGPNSIDRLMPPRKVKNLRVTMDSNKIYVKWDANTDIDLAGYNIFLNSNYVKTVGKLATSSIITKPKNLKPGDSFEIGIEAFDTDGDFSSPRTKVTVSGAKWRKEIFIEDEGSEVEGPVISRSINNKVELPTYDEDSRYNDLMDEIVDEEIFYENKIYCSYPEFYEE